MKKFPLWSILELRLTVNELVKIICFEKEKLEMCRMAFRGIADFLFAPSREVRRQAAPERGSPVSQSGSPAAVQPPGVWAVVLNYNGLRDNGDVHPFSPGVGIPESRHRRC